MPGSLKEYQRKRDFNITGEPKAKKGRAGGSSFVIQKHAARRLHYDFRLELDGVLKSWAVTRGPSLVPGEKRLAVHVEDHPLDYGSFEGTIPEGQYGAGSVMLWDRGTWAPEGDARKGYAKGHLDFTLNGEKLHGRWHLVRMRGKAGEKHENWLLIKSEDEAARTPKEPDILDEQDRSVASGRSIAQIGKDRKSRTWTSSKASAPSAAKGTKSAQAQSPRRRVAEALRAPPAAAPKAAKTPARKAARSRTSSGAASTRRSRAAADKDEQGPGFPSGLRKRATLAYVEPQLATLTPKAPEGRGWLHEIKFDGYRMQAIKDGGEVRLWTRRGLDWTERFQPVADAVARLAADGCHLDGEIVVEDQSGISDFAGLQSALKQGADHLFVYYVFDLLALRGLDLRELPLEQRKTILRQLLPAADSVLKFSEHFESAGTQMLEQVCGLGGEGIVSKKRDAPYRSGRLGAWTKAKCANRQEFIVLGYVPSTTSRKAVGSLALGYYRGKSLVYAGRVGTGFTSAVATDLFAELNRIRETRSPVTEALSTDAKRGVVWTKPVLVAEVEFRGWTGDGLLRQASFKGLREDKDPREIVREQPSVEEGRAPRSVNVRLTHPDRLLWPEAGITKEGLADHYAAVWPYMAPHVTGRPLALVRCPMGIGHSCFFQKHAWQGMPSSIRLLSDPKDDEQIVSVEDLDGLLALAQASVLEIHPWGAKSTSLERPDRLVFDLDPGEEVGWSELVAAALEVRERLQGMKLESFVKTSGGKGLHVVLPIEPTVDWETAKSFCLSIAAAMAKDAPERYTATIAKSARTSRIFVDYLRNGRGATAVCAYSPRARPRAGVSTPLTWSELSRSLGGEQFTLTNISKRLLNLKRDPWDGFAKVTQKLPAGRRKR